MSNKLEAVSISSQGLLSSSSFIVSILFNIAGDAILVIIIMMGTIKDIKFIRI